MKQQGIELTDVTVKVDSNVAESADNLDSNNTKILKPAGDRSEQQKVDSNTLSFTCQKDATAADKRSHQDSSVLHSSIQRDTGILDSKEAQSSRDTQTVITVTNDLGEQQLDSTSPDSVSGGIADVFGQMLEYRAVKILVSVMVPLGLYLADVILSVILVARYHDTGHLGWSWLTLGFVVGPSVLLQILAAVFLSFDDVIVTRGRAAVYLLHLLQLGVVIDYVIILLRVWRGLGTRGADYVTWFPPMMHLVAAVSQSLPQLCTQAYISFLSGDMSGLRAAVMVVSLLGALRAVVVFHYICLGLKNDGEEGTSTEQPIKKVVPRLTLFAVWKVLELASRVLAVGLCASAVRLWFALPLGIHWLVMLAMMLIVVPDLHECVGVLLGGILATVETFSVNFSMATTSALGVNLALTLAGNVGMATYWYVLQTGDSGYELTCLVATATCSVVSAVLGGVYAKLFGEVKF
ncbi:PREDICTED: uncharacterized protein LOC109482691 [Branchiostoma belcheri]|uniref:XK-related protein n=1 Tax=Branchiostoma belcheri TaxID=7741 RepID=A0A6P4ZIM7_BRABE|nr:PREDICTED: uncharacterized protein LOC109482691 [Branchiostoma belcheri]